MSAYFITGGTGFLGGHLIRRLTERGDKVYALVRPASRGKRAEVPGVTWVEGDLEDPDIVRDPKVRVKLKKDVSRVLHAAALYDLEATAEDLYAANIVGTHHVVHLASQLPNLEAFHFISTMAVSGNFGGVFTESMFSEGQTFPNAYASTKFAAEGCVRDWNTDVPRLIHRLGIVVGDSRTGEIPKIDGPYYLFRALCRNPRVGDWLNRLKVIPLPFYEKAKVYLVPVDAASDAILRLDAQSGELPAAANPSVFHIMGEPGGIPVRTVLYRLLRANGIDGKILCLPRRVPAVSALSAKLGVPEETLFYMYSPCQYSTHRVHEVLPDFHFPKFEEYSEILFHYARQKFALEQGVSP